MNCIANNIYQSMTDSFYKNSSTMFYRTVNLLPAQTKNVINGIILVSKITELVYTAGKISQLYQTGSGKRVYQYTDGAQYDGEVVNGEPHGKGIYRFADGDQYEGDFVNGERRGKGIYRFANGDQYEGDFLDGKLHGKGIYRFADGTQWEGNFVDDKRLGKGGYRFTDGTQREGDFVDGKQQGKGVYRFANGVECVGEWVNDIRQGHLKDKLFFFLLFGINRGSATPGYSLRIVSNYLLNYFADDKEMIESVVNPLIEAADFCKMDPEKIHEKLHEIVARLNSGRSYLLPYGHLKHATLLNLVPTLDGKFIECEIYNSGDGLRFHEFDKASQKYQLMKKYRIPIEQLSVSQLEKLVHRDKFTNALESYTAISSIEGSEIIQPLPEEQIWKKTQASENCENECIFALLAYKIPHISKQLRKDMFQDCFNAAEDLTDLDVEEIVRLAHKIKKLNLVIYTAHTTAPSARAPFLASISASSQVHF